MDIDYYKLNSLFILLLNIDICNELFINNKIV